MTQPQIIAFSGSARRASFNQRLVHIAAQAAQRAGANVTILNLADYPLPIFDEDLEADQGAPENATRLKALFMAADGFLIASPEYNSSITPLLKNTIDWLSRKAAGEAPLAAFRGKACALMSASPGQLGGLRALSVVRSLLGNIGVLLLPDQMAISKANEAFAEDGTLKDAKQQATIEGLGIKLTQLLQHLGTA